MPRQEPEWKARERALNDRFASLGLTSKNHLHPWEYRPRIKKWRLNTNGYQDADAKFFATPEEAERFITHLFHLRQAVRNKDARGNPSPSHLKKAFDIFYGEV